jgi:SAM-dependent methyltransferase
MIHPHGYWLEISKDNTHVCDVKLSNAIIDLFPVKTVVDIGCGDGRYVSNFLAHGIQCEGYDGSPLTPELTNEVCKVMDFSEQVDIGKFDLVLSLEVGEHIPKKYEQVFIDNLCRTSNDFICLSWAVPGQPGYGHVNCQNNEYVINEMSKRGFGYLKLWSHWIRKQSELEWFKDTLMIYGLEK